MRTRSPPTDGSSFPTALRGAVDERGVLAFRHAGGAAGFLRRTLAPVSALRRAGRGAAQRHRAAAQLHQRSACSRPTTRARPAEHAQRRCLSHARGVPQHVLGDRGGPQLPSGSLRGRRCPPKAPAEACSAAARGNRSTGWPARTPTARKAGATSVCIPSGSRLGGGHIFEHGVFAQAGYAVGAAAPVRRARGTISRWATAPFFSPSGGATLGRGRLRARASVLPRLSLPHPERALPRLPRGQRASRAPTPDLRPETLFGAEAGVDFVAERLRASVTALPQFALGR